MRAKHFVAHARVDRVRRLTCRGLVRERRDAQIPEARQRQVHDLEVLSQRGRHRTSKKQKARAALAGLRGPKR